MRQSTNRQRTDREQTDNGTSTRTVENIRTGALECMAGVWASGRVVYVDF